MMGALAGREPPGVSPHSHRVRDCVRGRDALVLHQGDRVQACFHYFFNVLYKENASFAFQPFNIKKMIYLIFNFFIGKILFLYFVFFYRVNLTWGSFFNRPAPEVDFIFIVRTAWKQLLELHCRTTNPKCPTLPISAEDCKKYKTSNLAVN